MHNNEIFLQRIDPKSRASILEHIARHYGISAQDALEEVVNEDAEHILDYMREPDRQAASVLMQRHGCE